MEFCTITNKAEQLQNHLNVRLPCPRSPQKKEEYLHRRKKNTSAEERRIPAQKKEEYQRRRKKNTTTEERRISPQKNISGEEYLKNWRINHLDVRLPWPRCSAEEYLRRRPNRGINSCRIWTGFLYYATLKDFFDENSGRIDYF
ncbi:uncharacterized protein [Periplaneta americana]|uniref:uncharacterized protein n=1 Tax=Periplaneta americana TaxID=6978 RepID=UPI0037E9261F